MVEGDRHRVVSQPSSIRLLVSTRNRVAFFATQCVSILYLFCSYQHACTLDYVNSFSFFLRFHWVPSDILLKSFPSCNIAPSWTFGN